MARSRSSMLLEHAAPKLSFADRNSDKITEKKGVHLDELRLSVIEQAIHTELELERHHWMAVRAARGEFVSRPKSLICWENAGKSPGFPSIGDRVKSPWAAEGNLFGRFPGVRIMSIEIGSSFDTKRTHEDLALNSVPGGTLLESNPLHIKGSACPSRHGWVPRER